MSNLSCCLAETLDDLTCCTRPYFAYPMKYDKYFSDIMQSDIICMSNRLKVAITVFVFGQFGSIFLNLAAIHARRKN